MQYGAGAFIFDGAKPDFALYWADNLATGLI